MRRILSAILLLLSPVLFIHGQNTLPFSANASSNNSFIENKGQWDKNILFRADARGMIVWITTSEIVFDFYTIKRLPRAAGYKPICPKDPVDSPVVYGHVVKMKILQKAQNYSSHQEIIAGEALEQYNNYFKGNDQSRWASYVKLYHSVYIKNYVQGVDLKLYFDNNEFRYDLIVQAGVNPNSILLRFEGQDELMVEKLQTLLIKTSIGNIKQSELNIYQSFKNQQSILNSAFIKYAENEIGFNITDYNPVFPVIIDPIVFSTLLGSNYYEYGIDIEADSSGNSYVGGIVYSANFPTTVGAYHRFTFGNYDVFITKLNSTGTSLIYSTYIGGNNVDYFYSLDIDKSGNCYYTGYTSSPDYPTTTGCYQSALAGYYYDVMVTKLNSSGTALEYSTYLGGWYGNVGLDIAVDTSNNAYVCGYAYLGFPVTGGSFQQNIGGSWDGFVTKFNSSGTGLIYSSFLGGNGTDYCIGIAVDDSNSAYLTGYTASSNFPTSTGCYQSALNSGQDAFVTKFSSSGSALVYSTYLGGNSSVEQATDIAVNNVGNACVTGNTEATNFPLTSGSGAYQLTAGGLGDGFISIINSTGTTLLYSTYIGGNNPDFPTHIAIDWNDNVVITGYTESTNYPTTYCAFQTSAAFQEIFITVLNPKLSGIQFSTYLGGNGGDIGTGITLNRSGYAYITGYTYSSNYPVSTGAYQGVYYGGYDAVITKIPFLALGMLAIPERTYCAGANFTMPYMAGCSFGTSNNFTIQLSNASGSFNSPVTLGTLSSQTSGTINCNIPKNTAPGSGYRIRLVSSNPFFVATENHLDIRINPAPVVQFSINNTTQCLKNNNFQFTNSSAISSGTFSNLWYFGDTATSAQSNPSHHYAADTIYLVKLIATSDLGCSNSLSTQINVISSPKTIFSVKDSFQCLLGNVFSFSSTTTLKQGTYTFWWSFGDGDSSFISNPKHSYKSEGNFKVKLTAVAYNGCADSVLKTMRILPAPVASFKVNDGAQCLDDNNFIFTNTSSIISGSATYKWIFGDGNTSTLPSPTHVYYSPDNYAVLLIATSDSGCKDSASKIINIAALPVAGFTVNSSNQCFKGNLFSFTNQSIISKGNIRYLWYYGDGKVDTIKNPSHSYLSDGSYKVKLIAFGSPECADTFQSGVVVNPSPLTSFSVNDSDQCFNQNNFVFTNSTKIKSGSQTFFWTFGDGTNSTDSNHTHSYSSSGNFNVQLTATSNFNCKASVIHEMLVNAHPVVNLGNDTTIHGNQILVLNAGGSIDSAKWSNGATTDFLVVDSAHFGGLGIKTISVKAYKSGCAGYDTIRVTITSSSGIDFNNDPITLSVFPNPVDERLQLIITGNATKADVSLFDMLGNRMFAESYHQQGRQIACSLDMSKYPKGAYLLKVICNKQSNVVKVIKN